MNEHTSKFIVSLVMWIGILGISLATLLNSQTIESWVVAVVALGSLIAGTIGTAAIWSPQVLTDHAEPSRQAGDFEKAKRQAGMSKLDLLMEMMDDDEREAFKHSLKRQVLTDMRLNDDGELPDAASVLWDEERLSDKY